MEINSAVIVDDIIFQRIYEVLCDLERNIETLTHHMNREVTNLSKEIDYFKWLCRQYDVHLQIGSHIALKKNRDKN